MTKTATPRWAKDKQGRWNLKQRGVGAARVYQTTIRLGGRRMKAWALAIRNAGQGEHYVIEGTYFTTAAAAKKAGEQALWL